LSARDAPGRRIAPRLAGASPRGAALIGLVVLAVWLPARAADWRTPSRGEGPEALPIRTIDGVGYIGVNDLARVLDATKFWRSDTRRLGLRVGPHTFTLTVDNPFVVLDRATIVLPAPVRSLGGEIQVPVALVAQLPSDSLVPRLFVDARRARVLVLPASGGVGSPSVTGGGETRLVFPADRADEAVVVERSRAHFRIRFGGYFTGELPDSLPSDGLLRGLRPIASAGGSAFELAVSPEARGFRWVQDVEARRVTLELIRDDVAGLEPFAPEGPPGPRRLRSIVIDPGHGGEDAGVVSGGAVEKDLALALARELKSELERRLTARVVLTRTADRALTGIERAEIANRARADLVVSLHLDGFGAGRARGATAYCPPATFAQHAGGADGTTAQALVLLPWRDVASRHAVESRALAEAVLSALELRGQGPTRLRERLPFNLLGVNAPGLLLECATLTSTQDRERVLQRQGLRELAVSIAEGVEAYQRNP
jgi:N-acetylmuramoyl-L-alanine amidase